MKYQVVEVDTHTGVVTVVTHGKPLTRDQALQLAPRFAVKDGRRIEVRARP